VGSDVGTELTVALLLDELFGLPAVDVDFRNKAHDRGARCDQHNPKIPNTTPDLCETSKGIGARG
jgi:hypothetical protein